MYETFCIHPKLDRVLVGSKGTIISTRTWKELATHVNRGGYREISMNIGSRTDNTRHTENFKIHRLVAETYLDNPNNKETVNHIDANKLNNCLENLEWMTFNENRSHAQKLGLFKSTKLTPENKKKLRDGWRNWYEKNYLGES